MSERDSFAHYRAAMAELGFQPSSRRGQNFLLDPTLHRWLAEQAGAGAGDTVVEIGVGLGFLTRELAAVAGRVVGIEIDDRLLAIARRELGSRPNVELIAADALSGPGGTLVPAVGEAIAAAQRGGQRGLLVANLPYSISGPLIAEIAALAELPAAAVLLVQKELAERVAASPSTPDYGGLSVVAQASFRAAVLREVAPQVFRPRPKVTSAVLRLERRPDPAPELATAAARREFAAFVRALFQQRRKTLRTTLARAAAAIDRPPPALPPAFAGSRAEAHGADELVALWRVARAGS
ncbi:MAG: ribosomal RNA small subunit methyltransferase A [Planctomycetes bacterium]|nr:ribosomal RNA small subunit methyltransferase A [Planctomycetota bacterium]